ncbi:DEAD/DEAH box helicase [Nocardia abscessus]|nr:DEAD/DEAH box helicase [Nocardia abscessus]
MGLPEPVGRQHDVVYLRPLGHQVILGTAGTGKTVMALHRGIHLADPETQNNGPTALLTFNRSLSTYLRHLAGEHCDEITIETYAKFARGYLRSQGRMEGNSIANGWQRTGFIESAVKEVAAGYKPSDFFARATQFFDDELAWIDGNGLHTLQAYLAADRIGRMAPLQAGQRRAMWKIREAYRRRLADAGKLYDWPSLPSAVRKALAEDNSDRRYRHIVVDEAQDLSPEAIRSLAEAIPPDGSLTLFADYAQQIYGQRISWRSCGLTVAKHEVFLDNYRNSPEIARLALEMAAMPHFRDSADLVEPKQPQRAAGTKPTLVHCRSAEAEAAIIAQTARASSSIARVGVLARTRREAKQAVHGLVGVRELHDEMTRWDITAGVYAGTYHSAKGLEFDIVLLPFCSAVRMPDPEVLASFGYEEAAARESRLLYVGVTRARDELVITYTGELTPLLPPASSNLYQVAP